MSYTWTTGEVITADKLNATGGDGNKADFCLIKEFDDGIFYGKGVSFDDLFNKAVNSEVINMWYDVIYQEQQGCERMQLLHITATSEQGEKRIVFTVYTGDNISFSSAEITITKSSDGTDNTLLDLVTGDGYSWSYNELNGIYTLDTWEP